MYQKLVPESGTRKLVPESGTCVMQSFSGTRFWYQIEHVLFNARIW